MRKGSESRLFQEALSVATDRRTSYVSAPWLLSSFDAPVWQISTGREGRIDFRVMLEDGLPLTHPKHHDLERAFKCFLIIQTHPHHSRGLVYSSGSAANRILSATHICEYLVLRAETLRLGEFGLQAVSESEALVLLKDLATAEVSESVYRWSERLTTYLRQQGDLLTATDLVDAIKANPEIASLSTLDRALPLTDDELIRARAWLWRSGYYKYSNHEDDSMYSVDTTRLVPVLYPGGTLKTLWKKPSIPDLHVFIGPKLRREKRGVSVRGERRTEHPIRVYLGALGSLRHLERVDLAVPTSLVRAGDSRSFRQGLALEPLGRYRSLPHELVLASFRNAMEFSLEYGEELLEAYSEIAKEASLSNASVPTFLADKSVEQFLGTNLLKLGTNCWSVRTETMTAYARGKGEIGLEIAEPSFFSRLRSGEGLYELLWVLGGSLLVILGTLMARRQGELVDLKCGTMLDESKTRLRFEGRKSGAGDIRRTFDRPLPPIGVELLQMVERFQEKLIRAAVIDKLTSVFAFPKLRKAGLRLANPDTCGLMLDRFCDYFSLPVNSRGERYYIRQHQLRRFFAMLFFWGNSFSGLETLRWFLGQSDSEHLYHYITESTPGEVLRNVKVDFTVERTLSDDPQTLPLLALVEERFHTKNVHLLDADEIADFVDELMRNGQVTVEPHFFHGPDGSDYTVVISVTRKEAFDA